MKISVLGTNGFLSSAIGKYACEHGWHLDMYGLEKPDGLHYDTFYEINVLDKSIDCTSMLSSDIIIYAIGAGIQSNLDDGADLIYALNVVIPVTICNKLKALDYKGIVVTFGSYFEIGEINLQRPATEQDILNATAPAPTDYVVSKRLLTRFVTSYKHGFVHWHFILPTIYGPGENSNRLIPYTIKMIRQGEEPYFTSGTQVRQYLYVGDVPSIIFMAMKCKLESGIYNIAGDEILPIKDIVATIYLYYKAEMPVDVFGKVNREDIGMKYLSLNGDKLKKQIGIVEKRPLLDTLRYY